MERRLLLLTLGIFLSASVAQADAPVALYLFPAGGQHGTTVSFHAGGLNLNKSCDLEMVGHGLHYEQMVKRTTSPWFEGPLLPLPDSQRQEDYPRAMLGSVKIAADASLGDRHVLLRTAQGITEPLTFVVGDLPEILEQEIAGEPVPVRVVAPVTINGRIFPREDVDVWEVALHKGQTLSALVDAARIGSPLQAKIKILDPKGTPLAEDLLQSGRDPRVRCTAAVDGIYQVRITDVRSEGGPAFVYRLTLTTGQVVDQVFPRGGRRGSTSTYEATGSMPSTPIVLSIPDKASTPYPIRSLIAGEQTLPFPLETDDLPEMIENEKTEVSSLVVPSIANGRISRAGEIDRWSFSAQQGEAIELALASPRSPLLGVLSVMDSTGKVLHSAEPSLDTRLQFVAPTAGQYFATVQDRFKSRGGADFAYRLKLTHPVPGFDLNFGSMAVTATHGTSSPFKITARRSGNFSGPIALQFVGLPDGISVAKDLVLAAGQSTIEVPLKATTTVKLQFAKFQVRGTALIPLTAVPIPVSKRATWLCDSSINEIRLVIAMVTPFKIVADYELKAIPRGTVYSRHYRIERNGFVGPIEIDLADRQARHLQGVTGPSFVVPTEKSDFDYPITLPPWMETGRTCRVCVMGTASMKDVAGTTRTVTYSSREQNDQIIAVVEPEKLALRLDRNSVRAEPGKTVELPFIIRRGEKLQGVVKLEILQAVKQPAFQAEIVSVPANSEVGKLMLKFPKEIIAPFPEPFVVRATLLENGQPVTAEAKFEVVSFPTPK